MRTRRPRPLGALSIGLTLAVVGCATFQGLAALRRVDFRLAGSEGTRLAGIDITRVRSYEDVGAADLVRLGAALSQGRLPVETVLQVRADNPADNVEARLLRMDWTLLLDSRETVHGGMDREVRLPVGQAVDVPVRVELDLLEFFDEPLPALVDLALALSGSGDRQRVELEALPTIETRLGPIRYPEPIRIRFDVGG
ncbi:MAG TPA: hypothetical protein VK849_04690 [Longimicrobiales bacterium]|nr:hypothetical protein [Longimicrobiales bacterium]